MPDKGWDALIDWLPSGDVQYVRLPDGRWGVAIFAPGTMGMKVMIAEGLDKNVAAWFAQALREKRPLQKG
jgi:hypothetical protein